MNRRIIGLVLALILAAGATVVLFVWLQDADERAQEEVALAEVYVATGDIEAGTPAAQAISQGLITRAEIPRNTVAPGAVGSLEQLEGLVVTGPIFEGEQIIQARFGEAVQAAATVLEVPEGRQAVTVEAGVVPGLAGFVQVGDVVSVVGGLEIPEEEAAAPAEGEEGAEEDESGFRVQYVVQDAIVLAVGQRVVNYDEEGRKTGYTVNEFNDRYLFTIALPAQDIERLLFTAQQGTIWFTKPAEGQEPVETPGRTFEDVFP